MTTITFLTAFVIIGLLFLKTYLQYIKNNNCNILTASITYNRFNNVICDDDGRPLYDIEIRNCKTNTLIFANTYNEIEINAFFKKFNINKLIIPEIEIGKNLFFQDVIAKYKHNKTITPKLIDSLTNIKNQTLYD